MENINQAQYNSFNTIPDVTVTNIPIGVSDVFGAELGKLSMDFALPVALSPVDVEAKVTDATLDSFGCGSDTEVYVSRYLISAINEIGRQVLADSLALEANELSTAEELDSDESASAVTSTDNEFDPIIYAESETSDSQLIDYPEIPSLVNKVFDQEDLPPDNIHILDRFVKLDLIDTPGSEVGRHEDDGFSEFEPRSYTYDKQYLGSFALSGTLDLELSEEPELADPDDLGPLYVEDILAAKPAEPENNQTTETLIFAGNL